MRDWESSATAHPRRSRTTQARRRPREKNTQAFVAGNASGAGIRAVQQQWFIVRDRRDRRDIDDSSDNATTIFRADVLGPLISGSPDREPKLANGVYGVRWSRITPGAGARRGSGPPRPATQRNDHLVANANQRIRCESWRNRGCLVPSKVPCSMV